MRINVIGSGHMGKQICSLFDVLGYDVLIWQNTKENLDNHINNQKKNIENNLNIKSSGSFKVENNLAKFENHFTIETVKENVNIKKKILSSLNFNENLFSNTSSIKLSEIGNNVNGFHFMNPITVKIVELCKKIIFSNDLLSVVTNSLSKVFYKIVNVKDSPGYLMNKVIFRDISYFFYLYEKENTLISDLKKIYSDDIKKNDPLKIVNMIGVDTCLDILVNLNKFDQSFYVPKCLQIAIKNNILGYKNKKVFKI
jgi:3-hydroxybutyryl-CoA dehydrogenase